MVTSVGCYISSCGDAPFNYSLLMTIVSIKAITAQKYSGY